uniref:Eukaryotic translation elongation factor 1 delta b (guanine nucleotide exchange protein) n=1 Tax=Kryptolebias marmoratus TaxID=37003 RepID=A0A3Q3AGH0_KRYMA
MTSVDFLAQEKIWFDKLRYDEAERRFYERMNGSSHTTQVTFDLSVLVVDDLRAALSKLECRVAVLEKTPAPSAPCTNVSGSIDQKTSAPVKEDEDDDDDIDLFGSDEDEEAEKLKEQRLKEYAAKKAKKPAVIAKSSILLDVKPWDDETDLAKLEECVRSVQADGLLWGTSKLVPVGYGIKKLQIACVVEDDKVGTDLLEEEITKFEDYVQSVDVAAFNKI